MKILLVEDEKELSSALKQLLLHFSYEVDCAFDGVEALNYMQLYTYDVIVMDVMMPKLDGIEATKLARTRRINTPILLLTAKSQVEDKIEGLDAGADDYLTKPFSMKELLARIRALSRRSVNIVNNKEFGDLILDKNLYTIKNGEKETKLTRKEYQLLEYLVIHSNGFVESEKLFNDVWKSDSESFINVVWVFIASLRKKLASIDSNVIIKVSRGKGYKLEYVQKD